jgi:hypothetical protein
MAHKLSILAVVLAIFVVSPILGNVHGHGGGWHAEVGVAQAGFGLQGRGWVWRRGLPSTRYDGGPGRAEGRST